MAEPGKRTCDRGGTLCGSCEADWIEEQREQEAEYERRQWHERLEARLQNIENRLDTLERRVNDVGAEVERVDKKVPTDLEARLNVLETLTPVPETGP